MVGPLADQTRPLIGNYAGQPTHIVSILDGLHAEFPNATITFVPGTQFLRTDGTAVPDALLTTPDGKPGLKADYNEGMRQGPAGCRQRSRRRSSAALEPNVKLTDEQSAAGGCRQENLRRAMVRIPDTHGIRRLHPRHSLRRLCKAHGRWQAGRRGIRWRRRTRMRASAASTWRRAARSRSKSPTAAGNGKPHAELIWAKVE